MSVATPQHLGNYELLGQLDQGGMAEIMLARQHSAAGISRLVVVKRVLEHRAGDPQFVQMFLDEARLVASISHPNVGQQDNSYYLVMELIRGLTVHGLIAGARQRGSKVPLEIAVELVIQACDGLYAAHELRDEAGRRLKLVHRDLSPHNLMVSEDGAVKLVDFGRCLSRQRRRGAAQRSARFRVRARAAAARSATRGHPGRPAASPVACRLQGDE